MKHLTENYKGYVIQKRIDVKMNSCLIHKGDVGNGVENLIKCIAGGIHKDGSEDSILKAKQWIDSNTIN